MILTCSSPRCGRRYRVPELLAGRKLLLPCGHPNLVPSPEILDPASDPYAGRVLGGRYRLLRQVGRGGMGDVYRADDLLLPRSAAIKLLAANLRDDPRAREWLLFEARAAARIHHPNVVTLYDCVLPDKGDAYMVMEYVDGPSLSLVLRDSRLTPVQGTALAMAVAQGLRAVHAGGLTHSDVKPANMILASNGRLKLADFGIAQTPDGCNPLLAGKIAGTRPYRSPEQDAGDPLDSRSDIYSLGASYYEMLTGVKPFAAEMLTGYGRVLTTRGIPHPNDVDPDLPAPCVEIMLRAMSADPDQRYQSAESILQAFRTALRDLRGGRM